MFCESTLSSTVPWTWTWCFCGITAEEQYMLCQKYMRKLMHTVFGSFSHSYVRSKVPCADYAGHTDVWWIVEQVSATNPWVCSSSNSIGIRRNCELVIIRSWAADVDSMRPLAEVTAYAQLRLPTLWHHVQPACWNHPGGRFDFFTTDCRMRDNWE